MLKLWTNNSILIKKQYLLKHLNLALDTRRAWPTTTYTKKKDYVFWYLERSSSSAPGKMNLIVKEWEKLQIDIAVLSESQKKRNGTGISGNYIHFYSGNLKINKSKEKYQFL